MIMVISTPKKTPNYVLRLEVFETDDKLVFVAEKPVYAKSQKAIKAVHSKYIKWAQQEFPEWREISLKEVV
jgi:hypothetical protein